jgi:hypothetical protein
MNSTQTTPLKVIWNKCAGNAWCDFFKVNLSHEHFDNLEGVYIIWHAADTANKIPSRIVRVGQGTIRDRLTAHRVDPEIKKFSVYGMYATWARVQSGQRNGVERFLADKLRPLVGDKFPDVTPIPVNLPA